MTIQSTIPASHYVSITTASVGASLPTRSFAARMFTQAQSVPAQQVLTFTDPNDVVNFFGNGTPESTFAVSYFGHVSKSGNSPKSLQFYLQASAETSAFILGSAVNQTTILNSITSINAGSFGISMGSVPVIFSVDFSADTTITAVVATLQAALNAGSAATYTASWLPTMGRFEIRDLTGNDVTLELSDIDQSPMATLGLLGLGAYSSPFQAEQTFIESVQQSISANNNFGSILSSFVATTAEAQSVAEYNASLDVKYVYFADVTNADLADIAQYSQNGTCTFYQETAVPNSWIYAAEIAAIDFTNNAAVGSFNFVPLNQSYLSQAVGSETQAAQLENASTNFIGVSQIFGSYKIWAQPGYMQGDGTQPKTLTAYVGAMWLRSMAEETFFNLLFELPELPANNIGTNYMRTAMTAPNGFVSLGVNNGIIQTGRELTSTESIYILQQTGDKNAARTMERNGYYLSVSIESNTNAGGNTEWIGKYTLYYMQENVISVINGSHVGIK